MTDAGQENRDRIKANRERRRVAQDRQVAARKSLVGDTDMTMEEIVAYQRRLKAEFLARQGRA